MINQEYKHLGFFVKSHELTLEIYKITNDFPKTEIYGLISQLRRASSSICSNIAEGSVRSTLKDYKSFLYNALGSAKEIEYQFLLAKDLMYITQIKYLELIEKLNLIIGSLINYMKKIELN